MSINQVSNSYTAPPPPKPVQHKPQPQQPKVQTPAPPANNPSKKVDIKA